MRSTRAAAALERLKARSGDASYAMVGLSDGRFYLARRSGAGTPEKLGEALPLDDFVAFVNAVAPGKPRKVSKLDVAFERQLVRKDRT
jgi:hypothetical protein